AVPAAEATLFVPSTAPVEVSAGSAVSSAGSWISPPPPTTASTQPARKAAPISSASVSAESSTSWSISATGPVNTAPATVTNPRARCHNGGHAGTDLGPRRHPGGHLPRRGPRPRGGARSAARRRAAARGGSADPRLELPRDQHPGRSAPAARAAPARRVRADQAAL